MTSSPDSPHSPHSPNPPKAHLSSPFTSPLWDLSPPSPSELSDHGVPLLSDHLMGKRVGLLVCGGIAAMKAPLIARALRRRGAEVYAFVSEEASRYVGLDALSWSCDREVITRLSARAEHLGDGAPLDAYLVAPATYNTINKAALGIADGLLSALLASAIGRVASGQAELLIAPTMHGTMHNPILIESLRRLRELGATLIKPRDAYGKDNLPHEDMLAFEVSRALSRSPLKGRGVLVTGGPTPVALDGVRRVTNKFTGALALEITRDLAWAGADVRALLGGASLAPSVELEPLCERAPLFRDYLERCEALCVDPRCEAGVFSAAVADYEPSSINGVAVGGGKLPSGQASFEVSFTPTAKVIDRVRALNPALEMVTFKYQEQLTHEALMTIARERAARFGAVVANRGEERGPAGEQVAWLLTQEALLSDEPALKLTGKPAIARAIRAHLEARLSASSSAQRSEPALRTSAKNQR